MSETEETYTIPEPTLVQQVEALQREVAHVTEQLTVEHSMMLDWKARAKKAEHDLEVAHKASGRTQGRPGPKGKAHASDGLYEQSETMDSLA